MGYGVLSRFCGAIVFKIGTAAIVIALFVKGRLGHYSYSVATNVAKY